MSDVTIVIPNWNGMKWLPGCLTSLRSQSLPVRVIMIDNGSEDGSVEYVRAHFPEVGIRAFHRNTGFCAAVNEGIRLSRTPYVILLNNDVVCEEHFAEKLLAFAQAHPDCFSAAAKMLQMDHPDLIDDAGDYYCALGWAFADGKGKKAETRTKAKKIFSACGGAAIYRREVFEKIGLFDERHFAYLEDVDIGYRARLAGYENYFAPEALVYHAGSGASGSAYNLFKTTHTSRNSVYLIRKNMPLWQILLNAPLLLAGFLIKTVFFIRKGMGRQYVAGLWKGAFMKIDRSEDGPVKYRKVPIWNYVKIQLQLWRSLGRRFCQR